jgi:CheY-like chemotaxis protein
LRILLVEDDALIRETTAEILSILGHSVAAAANGVQKLSRY